MTKEDVYKIYCKWREAAEKGYGETTSKSAMDRIDAKIRNLKVKYEKACCEYNNKPYFAN